ncbi:lysosome-associated membrane glycoprotein 2 isoform X2 [Anarrhichthys ocellatus]|uniref:lysosome-associated membrane glycoprotein 2 isoform X2 n=1 Tax=Anarrhichthys ocellatus TaxID=433405 RepID=UPI0012EDE588|nr:lysosome-associated membrane glycoprotein 2 isoform X2 [Anarrhichthys ocellatus]
MYRYASSVLFLASVFAFQLSHGTEVTVKDKDNNLCLYGNLMVNFSVSYDVADKKSETAMFELPGNVTTDGSACDNTSSTLKLNFGEGHSWSVNFTIKGKTYQADTITFSYNLSDTVVFPKSVVNDTLTVNVKPQIAAVSMDTCYSCKSKDTIEAESVNQTLWNVLIQAFVINNTRSENITSCAADVPSTPVAPTTHPTTTTPAAPVTNSSTAPPPTTTPTPTPTLPTPTTGEYSIKPDENSTVCLMANFGLRISVNSVEMNFEPNGTTSSGSCGVNSSQLVLTSNAMTITLTFAHDTKKFHLHALNITGKTSSGVAFSEVNTNLSLWEAAVGSSYMCNKEQNDTITRLLTLYTFDLHVQPFGVNKGVFSTAEECYLDSDLSFLVPIAVGVALSFLIILVLISYLIGRRKSRTGYQSV